MKKKKKKNTVPNCIRKSLIKTFLLAPLGFLIQQNNGRKEANGATIRLAERKCVRYKSMCTVNIISARHWDVAEHFIYTLSRIREPSRLSGEIGGNDIITLETSISTLCV